MAGRWERRRRSAREAGGDLRYRLLETVRQYARERLEAIGEAAARDRHLAWYLALAEEAEPQLRGPDHAAWLEQLETEHDNLRAALAWARERGAAAEGLRLAGALWPFWETRGYLGEGRGWLEAALAVAEGDLSVARARALSGAGILAFRQGDYARALAQQEEALALFRDLGDRQGIARSLGWVGWVAYDQGEYGRATALLEESLALFRALGDRRGIAASLRDLGVVACMQGEAERAAALNEESLALSRALGDQLGVAGCLANLGWVAQSQGEYDRAAPLYEESLALSRALGDQQGIADSLAGLGCVAIAQGKYQRAGALLEESLAVYGSLGGRRFIAQLLHWLGDVALAQGVHERAAAVLEESLRLSRDLGARDLLAGGLERLAWLAAAEGRSLRAARLGGAAEVLREAVHAPLLPAVAPWHERAVQAMRAAPGEEAFAAGWAGGRAMSLDAAVALALEGHTDTPGG